MDAETSTAKTTRLAAERFPKKVTGPPPAPAPMPKPIPIPRSSPKPIPVISTGSSTVGMVKVDLLVLATTLIFGALALGVLRLGFWVISGGVMGSSRAGAAIPVMTASSSFGVLRRYIVRTDAITTWTINAREKAEI